MSSALLPSTPLAGLVLAGGRSRRFGAEKAVQILGGVTLLERALASLDPVCAAVAISASGGAARDLALRLGRPLLADAAGHAKGPLAGVVAGLAWAAASGFAGLVTLPCDTPLVGADVLRRLIAAGGNGAYAVTPDGPQSLVALWPTRSARALAERLARGDHPPVRSFLQEIGAQAVLFEDPAPFVNANTPADLAAIAAQLTSPSSIAAQTDPARGTSPRGSGSS